MIYLVDFEIHGHHEIEVEAESRDEAISVAEDIMGMTDFGALNYDVDADVYSIEDEDGNVEYEF